MAKIKQGILGGFSGKVAGVVGTSWKGRAVMKSRPLSVANPRTDAQQEQRGKFSKIAELASKVLTTFVQPVENPISGDISGYNKFVKDNKSAFSALGKLQAASFVAGGGKLPFLDSLLSNTEDGDPYFHISWTNAAGTSALRLTDKVYACVFDLDGNLLAISSGTATRNDQVVNIPVVADDYTIQEGDDFVLLVALTSADGREVSVLTSAIQDDVKESA